MSAYIGDAAYQHGAAEKTGVLLVNLGTPEAPTAAAVRRYLRQFLSDRRVIETPRFLWWWILNLLVLPSRPPRTARAYGKVWTAAGSPLLDISLRQRDALRRLLPDMHIALGMSYGKPAIADALRELAGDNCRRLLVLPLYPQYAGSTTGSVFDETMRRLAGYRAVPHVRFVAGYADEPRYIAALAASIAAHRRARGGADLLIFSFHGTPAAMLHAGDPYHCQCHKTARLTAEVLRLAPAEWMVTFQSRFGRAVWLKPYTDETLRALPARGIKSVQVVCPAFAADCLETLEEIAEENRDIFTGAGGGRYEYIPALNDAAAHMEFLRDMINEATGDWRAAQARENAARPRQRAQYDAMRAAAINTPPAK